MKMHTVKLVFKINAVDQDEANVKALRLAAVGIGEAANNEPKLFNALVEWDLDMKWDSDER